MKPMGVGLNLALLKENWFGNPIGILRSISHHVQCLNSQQLFYYIISLSKKKSNNNNRILAMDYVLDSLEFLFLHDD